MIRWNLPSIALAALLSVIFSHTFAYFPQFRFIPLTLCVSLLSCFALSIWVIITTSWVVNENDDLDYFMGYSLKATFPKYTSYDVWNAETATIISRRSPDKSAIVPNMPILSESLNNILADVICHYIESWHFKVCSSPGFPSEVDRAIRQVCTELVKRIKHLDVAEVIVLRIIPIVTKHIREFDIAERSVCGQKNFDYTLFPNDVNRAIVAKYNQGRLHKAVQGKLERDGKVRQQEYLRNLVKEKFMSIVPDNLKSSSIVFIIIKEILACGILYPLINLLANPDTINQLLESYGKVALQEQKSIKKLREVLDGYTPRKHEHSRDNLHRFSIYDNDGKFEKFISTVRRCNSLTEARRFKHEVTNSILDNFRAQRDDSVQLRRMKTAKRLIDQRIQQLMYGGGSHCSKGFRQNHSEVNTMCSKNENNLTLRDILYDPAGLGAFSNFLEKMNVGHLIKFWVDVDSFRIPLEDLTDGPVQLSRIDSRFILRDQAELCRIYDRYIESSLIRVSEGDRERFLTFLLEGSSATQVQYHEARRSVIDAQREAYEEMETKYFPQFKGSEWWFEFVKLYHQPKGKETEGIDVGGCVNAVGTGTGVGTGVGTGTTSISMLNVCSNAETVDDGGSSSSPSSTLRDDDKENIVNAMQVALNNIIEKSPEYDPLFGDFWRDEIDDSEVEKVKGNTRRLYQEKKGFVKPNIALFGLINAQDGEEGDNGDGKGIVGRSRHKERNFLEDGLFEDDQVDGKMSTMMGINANKLQANSCYYYGDDNMEENFSGMNEEGNPGIIKTREGKIHEAAPGDLGLAEAIDTLTAKMERLAGQESILDLLIKKAELTNNTMELRILRESKSTVQREIRFIELQRRQYILQESENGLYGRASLSINSTMMGHDENGRDFVLYIIEITRPAGEFLPASSWMVARRYREFHELNKKLRARFACVRELEFPRRKVMSKLHRDLLQKRRSCLERYLRNLLLNPAVCKCVEFREFLSQYTFVTPDHESCKSQGNLSSPRSLDSRDILSRLYTSLIDGIDEIFGNLSLINHGMFTVANSYPVDSSRESHDNTPSSSFPNLVKLNYSIENRKTPETHTPSGFSTTMDSSLLNEAEAELRNFNSKESGPFIKPISNLFLEFFALNRDSNWLRGKAVIMVMHQLFGNTVERKLRDWFKFLFNEQTLVRCVSTIRDLLFPPPLRAPCFPVQRSNAEMAASRLNACRLVSHLIPDLAGSVIGKTNAQQAMQRILIALNLNQLNLHLLYTLLDELTEVLFIHSADSSPPQSAPLTPVTGPIFSLTHNPTHP